jgi:two-component system, NarL family, nitrate/nitrite response regulator NarL
MDFASGCTYPGTGAMELLKPRDINNTSVFQSALIISEVRFLRDSLAEILSRMLGIRVCEQVGTLPDAMASAETLRPELVLLDVAFPGGAQTAMQLRFALPEANVIALGVYETEQNVIAWAEAGVAGYVPNTASVDELVALIGQINHGELTCPPPIVGGMWRRISALAPLSERASPTPFSLTKREAEILGLVSAGLSNKDIARRLRISLSTTKTHVHHVLGKLCLTRRADVMARTPASAYARLGSGPPP